MRVVDWALGFILLGFVILAVLVSQLPKHEAIENARLDAEIQHALRTTGEYIPKNMRMRPPPSERDQVRIADMTWSKTGFGTVMEATFKIRNANPHSVKDITILCELTAPSGTKVSRVTRTIYRRFDPGITNVSEFNMGFISDQASNAGCIVTDVSR